MKVKRFVAGLLFSEQLDHVLLVQKKEPEWQKGRYNAIGGRIEKGEYDDEAMCRVAIEQVGEKGAGELIANWTKFLVMKGSDNKGIEWEVHWFRAIGWPWNGIQMTDEPISVARVDNLHSEVVRVVPSLQWLVPLALRMRTGNAEWLEVREHYTKG